MAGRDLETFRIRIPSGRRDPGPAVPPFLYWCRNLRDGIDTGQYLRHAEEHGSGFPGNRTNAGDLFLDWDTVRDPHRAPFRQQAEAVYRWMGPTTITPDFTVEEINWD